MAGPEDRDLYIADKAFTQDVKDSIEREIKGGGTPLGAAQISGIKTAKFNRWYKDHELFRTFVDGCVALRNTEARKRIVKDIKDVTDPEKRAKLEIELLKHQDKEFGSRTERLVLQDEGNVLLPEMENEKTAFIEKHRKEQAEMLKAADEAANDDST